MAELSAFVIDAEPISVMAFARFLNSIGSVDDDTLRDWFVLGDDDRRRPHVPLERQDGVWHSRPSAAHWPMMLVSWYGANAYSRWANGLDWQPYEQLHSWGHGQSTLPSEAQWEYAAKGATFWQYPWGDEPPNPLLAQFGCHRRGTKYDFEQLPLSPVNALLGMSPFGLHHMAGNVWQWCADWYSEEFYRSAGARQRDPLNETPTGVRSERGGSWIGTGWLLRSTYRRGRSPHARGRCLGFRCTSPVVGST